MGGEEKKKDITLEERLKQIQNALEQHKVALYQLLGQEALVKQLIEEKNKK